MGFLAGRVSYLRYHVDGPAPAFFGPEHLEKLSAHAIGKQKVAEKDGTEAGWIAGEDILDVGFDLAKNIVNDALHFALRLDTQKLPADLLRAYAREELQALAVDNPGSAKFILKKQAREAAREKLEAEASDGRYLRRKAYPVLWDHQANQVLVGTTSASVLDRLHQLFQDTFGCGLVLLDAGVIAARKCDVSQVRPAPFVPGHGAAEVAWVTDLASVRFLGNELLLWLWSVLETEADVLRLADDSEVTVMLARTLVLECPRGQSGNETIRTEAPTKLPEARRAVQAGKLPRQAGLILVRHDQQYELTLQAETLAVSGAKLPGVDDGEDRVRLEGRVGQVRHLIETVDLLYGAFLSRRLGPEWAKELERVQQWLQREERFRLAESA